MDAFDKLSNYIGELEQGGKQARKRVVELVDEKKELEEENKTLKDNVEFLHSCLDDRDKSIQYAEEENERLKFHIEAKDKAYMSLLTDYNYLQARIKRMEKAFLEYVENHKKLEDELDDVIMNR